jgi:hypothetical protein
MAEALEGCNFVMNYFNRDTDTIDGPVRSLLEILLSNPSFFLSHGIIILLFIFFLRAEITYLSISIPAVLLASYHEWTLNIRDGNSTIRYSALGLLIPWLATFLYRLAKRRTLMHNLVRYNLSALVPQTERATNVLDTARNASQYCLGPYTYYG